MNIYDFRTTSITMVKREVDFDRLKLLFLEFASSIDFDLYYQSFLQELSNIAELYSSPTGVAFILNRDNNTVGCVGLREDKPGIAMIKRLYIRSDFRRHQFEKQLIKVAIDWAQQKGMRTLRIDPCDTVHGISKLCIEEGFTEIPSSNVLTANSLTCLELRLTPKPEYIRQLAAC
jgi:GNAT superfamily N-acetyltransferase